MSDAASPCEQCPGLCCSFKRGRISLIELDEGERYDSAMLDYEYIDDLLLADGTPVDMRWYVVEREQDDVRRRYISFDCQHLTDDGRCGVYPDRPYLCEQFQCQAFEEGTDTREALDAMEREDSDWDNLECREVTDRVTEIIERRAATDA